MNDKEMRKAAKKFAETWKDRGSEKSDTQQFWNDLLTQVYGVEDTANFITYEKQTYFTDAKDKKQMGYIDAYIDSNKVLIEQKSLDVDLLKKKRQSDGRLLTPFQQAKRYIDSFDNNKRPEYIIVCNFKEFLIYDMNNVNKDPERVLLKDLSKEFYRLKFLVKTEDVRIKQEEEISVKAGEIVRKLYQAMLNQYDLLGLEEEIKLNDLNVLCVRLVFCLYAEDAGLFEKDRFYNYLKDVEAEDMKWEISNLFKVLNTDEDERDKNLSRKLSRFPYVNGSLFGKEHNLPDFTNEIKTILLEEASAGFDWSNISPTIFGAVFENTLNPVERRKGGMHYTSIENIHKVIDPLFLNDLKEEFENIKSMKVVNNRVTALKNFHDKLGQLTFLDPACGSGNFLTETYICLRRLENEVIKAEIDNSIHGNKRRNVVDSSQVRLLDAMKDPIKVQLNQFCGIEINDFAVAVAKTALWIAESQMMEETAEILTQEMDFLPLKSNSILIEGNSLRIDWEEEIKLRRIRLKKKLKVRFHKDSPNIPTHGKVDYIMGNPPFKGGRTKSKIQKADHDYVFDGVKGKCDLDYVSCWFKLASKYMAHTQTRAAFVATSSITQGVQVAILWRDLFEKENMKIDFCYKNFLWQNESNEEARVFCVIIGFSDNSVMTERMIYSNGNKLRAKNINGYLMDYDNIYIDNQSKQLSGKPELINGCIPVCDGNYLFSKKDMLDFVKKEPGSQVFFKEWYGSKEFIDKEPRFCLYLNDYSYEELTAYPNIITQIKNVRDSRLESSSKSTRKLADSPTKFKRLYLPKHKYLVIPCVSSCRRRYIPIGFLPESVLPSNKLFIMENPTIYYFGVLTSNVHMVWNYYFCGRLKEDYNYTKVGVYNNFPWPNPTKKQKKRIEETAQHILDVRDKYKGNTYAYLYDPDTMPYDLLLAHEANDKAVMEAYGMKEDYSSSKIVEKLIKMYSKLVEDADFC